MSAQRKYGLYVPPKKVVGAKPVAKATGLFGDDDDDTTDRPTTSTGKRNVEMERALEEDPAIFDYDQEPAPKQQRPSEQRGTESSRAPKYMEQLLKQAEERKEYKDLARVRLMKKEAALDAQGHAGKEVFVTAAYKRRLEAMQGAMDKDSADMEEGQQQEMHRFYGNLMRRNVAYGSGTGGRIREGEKGPREYTRYGAARKEVVKSSSNEEEEESFGPTRQK